MVVERFFFPWEEEEKGGLGGVFFVPKKECSPFSLGTKSLVSGSLFPRERKREKKRCEKKGKKVDHTRRDLSSTTTTREASRLLLIKRKKGGGTYTGKNEDLTPSSQEKKEGTIDHFIHD